MINDKLRLLAVGHWLKSEVDYILERRNVFPLLFYLCILKI